MTGAQRHRAREAALQILYQWQVGGTDVGRAADVFFGQQWPEDEPPPNADVVAFATALASDTVQRLGAVDTLIADTSERWRPERMAVIDRLIIRMSICEMQRDRATPPAVIINEALELARTFSTEDAVKFINGVLDGVRSRLDEARES